jgi:SAM-dependent methyltransferase
MSRITTNRPYGLLAKYYDELFTFHLSWYEAARQRVLGGILLHLKSACDLACGTGTTALMLASKGIKMYGVDLSPTMCRLAREKSRCLGLRLRVVVGDMRHFRLTEPVDLILCEFDALNHLERKGDLTLGCTCCFARFAPRRLLLLRREQPPRIRNDLARHVVGGKARCGAGDVLRL